ncbi:O-antigen ligase family protein [uncultured Flavobacterium sp.]|uniref:O-antigen ligase family protein n=1 Tax=uncultured Flavobacterium sp. TaxID=165435 RepID=UPI0025F4BDA5|nr:O-antigen ligase family protein [uncultured Flavobacterium sp.]
MKIKATTIYAPIFVLLLLLQLYLPSFRANIVLQIGVLVTFLFFESNILISKKFLKQLLPIVLLLVAGFVGTLFHKYETFDVIKDIFHFIKPIVGIFIGYFFFRKINNLRVFVQVVVISGVISALIHFYIILFKVDFASGSISAIREFTRDNFLELFAIFFLLFYRKFESRSLFNNIIFNWGIIILLSMSCMLYFSRTMIVILFLILFTVYGYTKITKKTLIIISLGISSILLLFVYLNNANIRRAKPGLEGFLYKVKVAPEEIFVTNINRDDHRDLWDHWRGYEAMRAYALMERSPSSFVVGTGHGSLVNLKFFAPLSGDSKGLKHISELHNGYMYIFYKVGAIGMLIYLFILFRFYAYIYKKNNFVNVFISVIGLVYLFSTITITGLYNGRDVIIFILGGLLYYSNSFKKESAVLIS